MLKKHHYLGMVAISLALFTQANTTAWLDFALPETKMMVYFRPVDQLPIRNRQAVEPNLTAQAVVIVDVASGARLFEKNPRQLVAPASTTKLMTALVALETFQPDESLVVPPGAKLEGATAALFPGEELTVYSLLQASLIQSANDAAYTLAAGHPEGIEGFVAAMNKKAQLLGMNNTSFTNPIGFDHAQNYSTAFDLAILARQVMNDEMLQEIVSMPSAQITDVSGATRHWLTSTHQLIGKHPEVVGVKTGTTQAAGEVLITQVERDNQAILLVILGSQQRYPETLSLVDWTFNSYSWLAPEDLAWSSLPR
jgi:serine-type D-Ala-D-Ala carboxypeptidase (penicillin-binding protein 5/6)